jgi:hypothetical protein
MEDWHATAEERALVAAQFEQQTNAWIATRRAREEQFARWQTNPLQGALSAVRTERVLLAIAFVSCAAAGVQAAL